MFDLYFSLTFIVSVIYTSISLLKLNRHHHICTTKLAALL